MSKPEKRWFSSCDLYSVSLREAVSGQRKGGGKGQRQGLRVMEGEALWRYLVRKDTCGRKGARKLWWTQWCLATTVQVTKGLGIRPTFSGRPAGGPRSGRGRWVSQNPAHPALSSWSRMLQGHKDAKGAC